MASVQKWTPKHQTELEQLGEQYEALRRREQELNNLRSAQLTDLFEQYDIIDRQGHLWDALTKHADAFIEALQPFKKKT